MVAFINLDPGLSLGFVGAVEKPLHVHDIDLAHPQSQASRSPVPGRASPEVEGHCNDLTPASYQKPHPSPLHASTLGSPLASVKSTRSDLPSPCHDPFANSYTTSRVPQIITTAPDDGPSVIGKMHYDGCDFSPGPVARDASFTSTTLPVSPRHPNVFRSRSPSSLALSNMAGTNTGASRPLAFPTAPRSVSNDSAASTLSAAFRSKKPTIEGTHDVAGLIKSSGGPEAAMQVLLKQKQSQSQQNAQLWRLVDKQRAMILGLSKDLERAVEGKDRYMKKLKEVMKAPKDAAVAANSQDDKAAPPSDAPSAKKLQDLKMPNASTLDSDSQKHSPIDLSLAPYPVSPPADQASVITPQFSDCEVMNPIEAIPKVFEHAFEQYGREAEIQVADASRIEADKPFETSIHLSLPPCRSLPSQPPPRKPPPAPLQLRNEPQNPILQMEEKAEETDSDHEAMLDLDHAATVEERRGRRRTREEDERDRKYLVLREYEAQSLSFESTKSTSRKGTAKEGPCLSSDSALPPNATLQTATMVQQVSSLAAALNNKRLNLPQGLQGPLVSPGLPPSPRPPKLGNLLGISPQRSPHGIANPAGQPLSPRPPRRPILPPPPMTPLELSSSVQGLQLTSPKHLTIVKRTARSESLELPSPTSSREGSGAERTKIYKGFVTEEYPGVLLPPNALPSIDIKVASSRMKPSRASILSLTQLEEDPVFTLAIFSRADGGELWRVEKDSASLAKLDQRLKQCTAFTAKTPDRNLFSGHAPAKLDARRVALDQYLDELLNTPLDSAAALELCKYLSHHVLPPNADETGSSFDKVKGEPLPKTGSGSRYVRSGYLTKRGKNFGGWKARFFALEGPHLKYYETPGGAHLGTIKIQKAQIGKQAPQSNDGSPAQSSTPDDMDNHYRHAFLVLEQKKNGQTKHVLCAESDRERDIWVDALLRCIDYKDTDEVAQERRGSATSGASDRVSSSTKRKTHAGKQIKQSRQAGCDDAALIGVSYEATRQGDAPQGAPKSKFGPQDPESAPSSQVAYMAAPMPGSDTTISKLAKGLAPPSTEEKKVRKRSFFGFGPKARCSSDGQDSFGGNDSSSSLASQQVYQANAPVRHVFGATLAEAVRFNPPIDIRVPLPAVVYRCIQYLDARNAINEEGIFRLSGSNVVIKQLRERYNTEGDINLLTDDSYYDIHAVASLLKMYLRELPTTILTRDLYADFQTAAEKPDQQEKIAILAELAARLPLANATLLKYSIAFLIKIINNAGVNKMTVRNVGIVFSPTLNIPPAVFALFLQHYEPIFGIDPVEYELPSPAPDSQERRTSLSFSGDGPSSTRRSPHQQRLVEAGNRSSPTPPPLQQVAQLNAMRYSPSPPPQRTYEPSYLTHQSNQPGNRMSFRLPFDGTYMDLDHKPPSRATPVYERSIYENGQAMYDQSHSLKSSRRESTIFMGSLNQKGSKSLLRE